MNCKHCGRYIGDEPKTDFCSDYCCMNWDEELL